MTQPKILLLNPPAIRPIMRDGYCSQESKGHYYWAPMDLIAQSGILSTTFEVDFLDAVIERVDNESTLARIATHNYLGLIMMTGWVSFDHDMRFLRLIRERFPELKILCCGDVLRYYPIPFLTAYPELGSALADWASPDTPAYFSGAQGPFRGIVQLGEKNTLDWAETLSLGLPDYSRINLQPYQLPFPGFNNVATIMTSDGCPNKCNYCAVENAPFRPRDMKEIEAEIYLLSSRGVKNIFFHDPMLNNSRDRLNELCDILALNHGVRFVGFFRADKMNIQDVPALKKAGCVAMLLGIESPDDSALQTFGRKASLEKILAIVSKAREMKILTVGHFITRLSDVTLDDEAAFIEKCGTDFASVTELILRPGTTLFDKWLKETGKDVVDVCREATGLLPDQDGLFISPAPTPRARALMRRHYLRPRTIFRLRRFVFDPQSWSEIISLIMSNKN